MKVLLMPNAKNIFSLTILSLSLTLVACQPKPEKPEEPIKTEIKPEQPAPDLTPKLEGQAEKLKLELPECDGKNCPELQIERLKSNQPFIDEIIDREILQDLSQILEVTHTKGQEHVASAVQAASAVAVTQTALEKLETQTKPYAQAFIGLDEELKALNSSHKISLNINPRILNSTGALVTVVINTSSYLGGAHGSSSQTYYNFDLEKKTLVKLRDIVQPNQQAALENLAHEAFKTWVMGAKLADNIEEYEQVWKFSLTDNFYLGKNGLILQYDEYEIGPYVVGLPRLELSFEQLKAVLKPQYLPQVASQPASAVAAASTVKAKP